MNMLNFAAISKRRNRLSAAESRLGGLLCFNVYGPGEAHKGRMASVAHHLNRQLKTDG